jgi:hypothetical protein
LDFLRCSCSAKLSLLLSLSTQAFPLQAAA